MKPTVQPFHGIAAESGRRVTTLTADDLSVGRLRPLTQRPQPKRPARSAEFWRGLEADWQAVVAAGLADGMHRRLMHLRAQLTTSHRGVRESAIAEVSLAGTLLRRGAAVRWLPESQARTADLACQIPSGHFFAEVTAMVGAFRETHGIPPHRALFLHDPDGPVTPSDVLIHRLLARVSQKARQLAGYRDPVVLALSVPPQDEDVASSRPLPVPLDLRRLAGAVTGMLLSLPHLSTVVLSLWGVTPLPASSAVRLANVDVVERSGQSTAAPPVSLLVDNPGAAARLHRDHRVLLAQAL